MSLRLSLPPTFPMDSTNSPTQSPTNSETPVDAQKDGTLSYLFVFVPQREFTSNLVDGLSKHLQSLKSAFSTKGMPCSAGTFAVKPKDLILYYGKGDPGNAARCVDHSLVLISVVLTSVTA